MKLKNILLISLLLGFGSILTAQNEMDALRFSKTEWNGTARFLGAGGAFGAVGAEFSALSTNPASIALFKKTEISFTPLYVDIQHVNSTYNDDMTPTTSVSSTISNLGIVFAWSGADNSKWKKGQFGFGFNQIMNFNNKFAVEGRSNGSTMGSAFAAYANGTLYENLEREGDFAYQSYIIDPLYNTANNTQYIPAYLGKDLKQTSSVITSGRINEMTFSIGGNYDDKFYIGGTLGVPFISYTEKRSYEEVDDNNVVDHLNSFTINDKLMVNSTGVNLKLGILYQPVSFLRFGAAIHTPTFYSNVHDVLEREMVSFGDTTYVSNYTNEYNYQLITPLKLMGNVAFLILKRGFVSFDYEYTDYSKSELGSYGNNTYLFKDENKAIRDTYRPTHSIRLGGESYITKNILYRCGFSYTSSPYQNEINDGALYTYSLGLGYRTNSFFVDFAYVYKMSHQKYWFYDPSMVNPVHQNFESNCIVGTFGFKL